MGKGRGLAGLVFAVLKLHVGAAQSLTSEAYALARELRLSLDDVDREVLRDRLLLANRRLGVLFCSLCDDIDDLDGAVLAGVSERARRYRPPIRPREIPADHLALLVRTAARRARYAHTLCAGIVRNRESNVVRATWVAAAHLEIAAMVLGVARRRPAHLEGELAEHRRLVAEQRRGPGESKVAM